MRTGLGDLGVFVTDMDGCKMLGGFVTLAGTCGDCASDVTFRGEDSAGAEDFGKLQAGAALFSTDAFVFVVAGLGSLEKSRGPLIPKALMGVTGCETSIGVTGSGISTAEAGCERKSGGKGASSIGPSLEVLDGPEENGECPGAPKSIGGLPAGE